MNNKFEDLQREEFDQFFCSSKWPTGKSLTIEFQTLKSFIGDLNGKKVLDLGCGIGRNGIQIAGFASTVVGYDISDVAVTKANENAKYFGADNFHAYMNDFADSI